ELLGDRLLAIANAENGRAKLEDRHVRFRAARGVDARGTAGEDDRLRGELFQEGRVHPVERMDLAVDADLAQAAGDQLGDLTAEVDDQDLFVSGGSVSRHG